MADAEVNAGTVYIVLSFPHWPPPQTAVTQGAGNGQTFRFEVSPDGYAGAHVLDSARGEVARTPRFPILVKGKGAILVVVTWRPGECQLEINGRKMVDSDATSRVTIVSGSVASPGSLSFNDPDVRNACASAIERRNARYRVRPVAPGLRPVTLHEDLRQLEDALRALREYTAAVREGAAHHLPAMRGKLRELLVEKGGVRPYDPLLMRVAARLRLALPIYAIPDGDLPDLGVTPTSHFSFGVFGLIRELPSQVLIDFQDWLDQLVFESRNEIPYTKKYSRGELIAEAAESLGGAHYGSHVHSALTQLQSDTLGRAATLTRFLVGIAEVTIALGTYLLAYRDQEGNGE